MKIYLFALMLFLAFAPAQQPGRLKLADAKQILGEPARLTDSSSVIKNGVFKYNSTFAALDSNAVSGKIGKLYFTFEIYPSAAGAAKIYKTIVDGNVHNGNLVLFALGDEAFTQSDNTNFYFLMARKGVKVIRIKVNKLTGKTSIPELKKVAVKLVANF